MTGIIFHHPDPAVFSPQAEAKQGGRVQNRIVPLFLPFAGCRKRCVYCAQEMQTGEEKTALSIAYSRFENELAERFSRFSLQEETPFAVAFYGGTFTALPVEWQDRFLALARLYKEKGMISHVRCSTRPDEVSTVQLDLLRQRGLDMVELGIQSFDSEVLQRSGRGYGEQVATEACRIVREAGLELGIQLLPGLPRHTEVIFADDVARVCAIAPDVVRIYPCLVLPQTKLAKWYASGEYVPWSLEQSRIAVGRALLALWQHHIRVIRIGVAHDPVLAEQVLDGPYHPSFGSMVRAEALLLLIKERIALLPDSAKGQRRLFAPSRFRGEFWGHKGNLKSRYIELGLPTSSVLWWNLPIFSLT